MLSISQRAFVQDIESLSYHSWEGRVVTELLIRMPRHPIGLNIQINGHQPTIIETWVWTEDLLKKQRSFSTLCNPYFSFLRYNELLQIVLYKEKHDM